MATGRLAAVQTTAATNTIVYTVPTGKVSSCSINVLNSSGGPGSITYLALAATGASPTVGEYIEMEAILQPGDTLERTGIVLDAGKNIVIKTAAAMSVVVYGYEE